MDVSDAFLTVKQETPTVVTCVDASGKKQEFGLGKFFQDNVMEHCCGTETSQGFSRTSLGWKRWQHVLVYFVHVDKHWCCCVWMTYWLGDYSFIGLHLLPVLEEKYFLNRVDEGAW